VGVAPAGKVLYPGGPPAESVVDGAPLNPNYTQFVLVESDEWGAESGTMFALAEALEQPSFLARVRAAEAKASADASAPEGDATAGPPPRGIRPLMKRARKPEPAAPSIAADQEGQTAPDQGGPAQKADAQPAAQVESTPSPPVMTILTGGNVKGIAKDEVLRSVRKGWPILVLEGTGGLADEIAKLWLLRQQERQQGQRDDEQRAALEAAEAAIEKDPALAEIVEEGRIHLFGADSEVRELQPTIARLLPVWANNQTLAQAWTRFAVYDQRAKDYRKTFERLRRWILLLGVLGTFFVLTRAWLTMLATQTELPGGHLIVNAVFGAISSGLRSWLGIGGQGTSTVFSWIDSGLSFLVLLIPIGTTILITAANQFTPGGKWTLLRASAEAVKREIYTYRVGTAQYGEEEIGLKNTTPQAELAAQLENVSAGLMRTEMNRGSLGRFQFLRKVTTTDEEQEELDKKLRTLTIPPQMDLAVGTDDGLSPMTPDQYVTVRLGDQINFYDGRTARLERQFKRFQWWVFVVGGVGTFLAAVGLDLWIALTTAISSAVATYLEYTQTENTLMRYNQARTDLRNVQDWWNALSPTEQRSAENIRRLVTVTEQLLGMETGGWVQQMQDTLAELREQSEEPAPQGVQPEASGE
jgi:hypothetical protein